MQMKTPISSFNFLPSIVRPNSDVNNNCDMALSTAGNATNATQVNREVSLNLRVKKKNLRYEIEQDFKSGKGITYPFQRHVYLFVFQRKGLLKDLA